MNLIKSAFKSTLISFLICLLIGSAILYACTGFISVYIQSVIVTICTNVLSVVGLALLTGYTGMFSLGHAGFMCIGAYTAVLTNRYLGIPFIIAMLLGGIMAAIIAVIIGYPTLKNRLRGDYFAICMMGFGTIVRLILNNMDNKVFNGALGITSIPRLTTLWSALALTSVMVFFMWNFVHSQFGRNCLAIQQQEVAAEMMGVDIVKTKLISLVISAFYCGVAGGLLGFYIQYISPNNFTDTKSNDFLATLVTGGTNSITGPVLAAVLVTTMLEYLRFLANWRLVIYGLLYVVIMRFRPQGLMGYTEFSWKGMIRFFKNLPETLRAIPGKLKEIKLLRKKGDV